MHRVGGDTQALSATGYGGVVNRLNIDTVLVEKLVRDLLALSGIANQNRGNVRYSGEHGEAHVAKTGLQHLGVGVHCDTLSLTLLQVTNRGQCSSSNRRGNSSGKDESRRYRAHRIDISCRASDIATHDTKGLAKSSREDVNILLDAITLRDTTSALAIHAYSVDLVTKGKSVVLIRQECDISHGCNRAFHRVDRFEGNHLVLFERGLLE
mmetsp:Transcript_6779/g.12528  ORF Transcript_6779/g.12528 Transcript_6779/m.12528 type:complete len:210 (+) Transcript_6779:318-947(+)